MKDLRITPEQEAYDALKELVNIGSGNALAAFGQLLFGRRLELSVPEIWVASAPSDITRSRVPRAEGVKLAVQIEERDAGRPWGRFVILLNAQAAHFIPSVLLTGSEFSTELGVMQRSVLAETINIVASTFFHSVGTVLRTVLIPSPATVEAGQLNALARAELGQLQRLPIYIPNSIFGAADGSFGGRMLLVMDQTRAAKTVRDLGLTWPK